METLQADKWCDDSLKEWDRTVEEFTAIQNAPKGEGESTLLRSARKKRASALLATSAVKANVAMLVQQLMHDASRGTITIDVPEAQIDVRLTWNDSKR